MAKNPTKDRSHASPHSPRLPDAWREPPFARRLSLAAACVIAAGMVLAVVWMSGKDVLWPEDSFSDVNTLMAAEAFAKNGFFRLHFLPVHYAPSVGEHPNYYTHYPPLPDVVCGLVQAAGGTSLAAQRVVCGLFGIAGWLLLARAISRRLGALAGAMALLFVATSGFFLSYGVSVHQHGFNAFFVGAFLVCFLRATEGREDAEKKDTETRRRGDTEREQSPRLPSPLSASSPPLPPPPRPRVFASPRLFWGLAWGALFLESWTSFEFIVFTQAVAWLYVLIAGEFRRRWKALLVLATAPVAGVVLHFCQNAWAMGWAAARADFLGYGQYGGDNLWSALRKMPQTVSRNIKNCFGWSWYMPLLAAGACVLAGVLGKEAKPALRRKAALLAGLAAAPLLWYVGMASHAHHAHTAGQMMPIAAAGFGGAAALVALRLFSAATPLAVRGTLAGGLVVLALAASGQWEAAKKRVEGRAGAGLVVNLARALGPEAFGDRNGVLFNTTPEAQIGYFLRNSAQLCQMHLRPPGPPVFFRPDSLRGLPFVQSFPRLREAVGPDWTYRYYLFFYSRGNQEELYQIFKSTCRGETLAVEDPPGRFVPLEGRDRSGQVQWQVVRFDLTPLYQPEGNRTPLPADVRDRQSRNEFDLWIVPGFTQRLEALMLGHPPPHR